MRKMFTGLLVLLAFSLAFFSCDLVGIGATHGNVVGTVTDAVSGDPVSGVTVKLYASTGGMLGTTTTDSSGNYTFASIATGTGYYAKFTKTGYLDATYYGIAVEKDLTTYLETLLQISSSYTGTGVATGTITDAFTGNGLASATISFRAGINTTTGTVLYTATTDSSGFYTVTTTNLGSAGYFTGEISKTGYITTTFTVYLIAGQTKNEQNAAITPSNIGTNEYRFILTWGATPYDLDSHLTGPTGTGTDRFHVYFSNKTYTPSGAATPDVELDVDDTTSYGPETITLYNQKTGEYRYYVHDYSNLSATATSPSTQLSNSGAKVKVYKGSTLVRTFNIPTGQGGNCWDVFKLSGSTITTVNTISYIDDYSTGRALDDHGLMTNLPSK